MKKIILSIGALLSVGIAAAQSYPKQPDRTVVTYIEYKKTAPVENDSIAKQDVIQAEQNNDKKDEQASIQQPAASVNTNNSVSENTRNDKARKE